MPSEFNFIFNYLTKLGKNPQNFLNDGCEITTPTGKKLVTSKDMLISDVHFFRNDTPNSIAQKSLRKNLSDLAAMGAKPHGYLLGLCLPNDTTESFIIDFCDGLKTIHKKYKIDLLGGDTTSNHSNMIIISITIFGFTNLNNNLMPRNNAKLEDKIYISGCIGSSYMGYLLKTNHPAVANLKNKDFFLNNFLYGNCKINTGLKISEKANSCIDISDGLLQDLMHICKNSNVSAKIYSEKIPINHSINQLIVEKQINFHDLLTWGDDYELLICGNPKLLNATKGIYKIGEITHSEDKPQIHLDDKVMNDCRGFQHFTTSDC